MLESSRWRRPGRFLRDLNILALLVVIASGASLLLLPQSDDGLLGLPDLVAGESAPRTIKSPRTFAIEDPETTARLRREARGRERPTYNLHVGFGRDAKARIEAAFLAAAAAQPVNSGAAADRPEPAKGAAPAVDRDQEDARRERARAFMLALGVTLDESALLPLIKASGDDELRDAAIMLVKAVFEERIVEDKALLALRAPNGLQVRMVNPDGTVNREENVFNYNAIVGFDAARAKVDELVADRMQRFPLEERRAVAMLAKRLLKPNLIPNEFETERRKLAAERSVKTVVIPIKSGETVLRAGERVTERHLFILVGMEQELQAESRVQASAGSALLIVVLVDLHLPVLSPGLPAVQPHASRPGVPRHRLSGDAPVDLGRLQGRPLSHGGVPALVDHGVSLRAPGGGRRAPGALRGGRRVGRRVQRGRGPHRRLDDGCQPRLRRLRHRRRLRGGHLCATPTIRGPRSSSPASGARSPRA